MNLLTASGSFVRRWRFQLAAIVFVLLAWLLFFFAIPPFQTADEAEHFSYVQGLASGVYPVLPKSDPMKSSDLENELKKAFRWGGTEMRPQAIYDSPRPAIDSTKSDYITVSSQAYEPPVYYFVASLFYRGSRTLGLSPVSDYYITRIPSLLFYLLFLAVFWRVAGMTMEKRAADFLTLAIALQPTLLMVAVSVNPEMASIATFTLVFGVLLAGLRRGSSGIPFAVLLGILTAVAALTKFTGIIVVPVVFLTVALSLRSGWPKKLRFLAAYAVTCVFLLMPWLFLNLVHYRNPLPSNASLFAGVINHPKVTSLFSLFFMTLNDFRSALFALSGRLGTLMAPVFTDLGTIYTYGYLTLIVIGVWLFFRREKLNSRFDHYRLGSTLALVFLALFMLAYSWHLKASYGWVDALQGRYFLVGALPAMLLIFSGLKQSLRSMPEAAIARGLFFLSFMYFLFSLLFSLIPRFYV